MITNTKPKSEITLSAKELKGFAEFNYNTGKSDEKNIWVKLIQDFGIIEKLKKANCYSTAEMLEAKIKGESR
jgi:hypothetical protein